MIQVVPPDTHTSQPPEQPRHRFPWPTVVAVVLVLGCAVALLITGSTINEALAGAAGMALTGNEVARRIVADAGPLPVVIVASAVVAFGSVLAVMGYSLSEAAMGAGAAGLVAG